MRPRPRCSAVSSRKRSVRNIVQFCFLYIRRTSDYEKYRLPCSYPWNAPASVKYIVTRRDSEEGGGEGRARCIREPHVSSRGSTVIQLNLRFQLLSFLFRVVLAEQRHINSPTPPSYFRRVARVYNDFTTARRSVHAAWRVYIRETGRAHLCSQEIDN